MTVTLGILIVTVFVSYQAFNNPEIFHRLKHSPFMEHKHKEYYRLITSGFVHGSWMHLIVNMYVLYEFGTAVEHVYQAAFGAIGKLYYLGMYLLTIILADLPSFNKYKSNHMYSAIGASGGVSGVLFAYILFAPWTWLGLFFVIPIPAILFAILYLVYSSWASKNSNDNIDHSAHFMGAISGFLITIALKPSLITDFFYKVLDFQPPPF